MNSTNCIDSSNSVVSIIGLGYVGLPLAQALCKSFKIIGFDTDENKVNHLNQQTISTISTIPTIPTELSTADCRLFDCRLMTSD